ncbi:hypothetical protein MWU78_00815 [Arenibacter sp. F26102]|uniref:Uncharacterized protein n=1 Tax=Arenibacter arenosicollis TaxID=2762274 RepID=A0ABR7QKB7_9FLAO|nr:MULTISPECIES: hypothetical protein [Arenibacter]MBC8767494.1 hypothetical protein [Arenibacter arenosicollis]MCK0144185.1 hypothetical protein [Arenibacter sp. F26102]
MKKFIITILVLGLPFFAIISCRETKEKTVIIEKEVEKDKGILEKAGEKVDKEVNEKIDDAIDEIGDDN